MRCGAPTPTTTRSWSAGAGPDLRGARQAETVRLLGLELSNLRAAVRHLVYTDRLDDAGDFAWNLFVYWWISGFFSEVRLWMLELLGKDRPISTRTKAIAAFFTVWGEMWRRPSEQVIAGLGEASRLFAESGDEQAAAMALAARGSTRMRFPDLDMARGRAGSEEARDELHRLGDWWTEALADVGLGLLALARGAFAEARGHFERALAIARRAAGCLHAGHRGQQRRPDGPPRRRHRRGRARLPHGARAGGACCTTTRGRSTRSRA